MEHSGSDEPPSYVARAALDSVVLQQFADLLARRPPKRPPSDVPRPEIDEKLIADEHGAYPPEQGRVFGLKNKTMLFAPGWGRVDRLRAHRSTSKRPTASPLSSSPASATTRSS